MNDEMINNEIRNLGDGIQLVRSNNTSNTIDFRGTIIDSNKIIHGFQIKNLNWDVKLPKLQTLNEKHYWEGYASNDSFAAIIFRDVIGGSAFDADGVMKEKDRIKYLKSLSPKVKKDSVKVFDNESSAVIKNVRSMNTRVVSGRSIIDGKVDFSGAKTSVKVKIVEKDDIK